jgi:hypothetical protein
MSDPTPPETAPIPPTSHPRQRPDVNHDPKPAPQPEGEIGGPKGPEPTRFGDWERGGRCSDF